MATGILIHKGEGYEMAALYDTGSMWAFGPIFDSEAQAEFFLKWLDHHPGNGLGGLPGGDPRSLKEDELLQKYHDFRSECRPCSECGEWFEGFDENCWQCGKLECCGHRAMEHDDEGCLMCAPGACTFDPERGAR